MISISRIDHMNMKVKNLEDTIAFYSDLFGFKIKEKGNSNGVPFAILGLEDRVYLCLYEVGGGAPPTEGVRLNHFGFHVENFDQLEATLKERNIPLNYGGVVTYAHSRSIYIDDPNGFEIELSEHVGGNLH